MSHVSNNQSLFVINEAVIANILPNTQLNIKCEIDAQIMPAVYVIPQNCSITTNAEKHCNYLSENLTLISPMLHDIQYSAVEHVNLTYLSDLHFAFNMTKLSKVPHMFTIIWNPIQICLSTV